MSPQTVVPPYCDAHVNAWHGGASGRRMHLGYWDVDALRAGGGRLSEEFAAAQLRLDELLLTMSGLQSGQAVLDVGCGLGGLLQCVDSRFQRMQLTGVNIDPRQLDICQRLRSSHGNQLRWQEAEGDSLPFAADTFDQVFCVEAMFHFSSRRQFLKEAHRVLRPGGRLTVTDLALRNPVGGTSVPRFAVAAILNDGYGPWPDPWCGEGALVELCQESGFRDLAIHDATAATLPSYDCLVSPRHSDDTDPGDAATRALLMLRWLHRNGGLSCQCVSGVAGQASE